MYNQKRKRSDIVSPRITKEYAGYCTFLIDARHDDSNEKEKVSKKTKRKVYGTKAYICQYQKDFWNYLYHREMRKEKMEQYLDAQKEWSNEERIDYRMNHFNKERQYLRLRRVRTSLKEFTILSRLGKGGYGDVYLSRKIDTGEILALKRMKKSRFTDRNEVHKVKQEREVMMKSNSSWLAKLKYCFQSSEYLYMAMEYIPGGDLKNLLDQLGSLPEDNARFFFAEMLLAVDDLHKMGYIHRDLKPDNFMIDRTGHIKLIDFGLSKEGFSKKFEKSSKRELHRRESTAQRKGWSDTSGGISRRNRLRKVYSMVGSPEYMAVEVLNNKGYTHLVDYWSLGVILYELIYGVTPFGADTVKGVFENVAHWKTKLHPPAFTDEDDFPVSPQFWSLISQLIAKQEDRLQNMNEIQSHEWFKDLNWDKIREMIPPFIPDLKHEVDTSYFPSIDDGEKSIDLLVSRQLNANPLIERKLTKVYSFKDKKNEIKSDSSTPTSTERTEHENPKLKFNQSCSKFDFAGFTFQHEDLNVMVKSIKSENKRNSEQVPKLKLKLDTNKARSVSSNTSPRDSASSKLSSKTSVLIKSMEDLNVVPKHFDKNNGIIIIDDSINPLTKIKRSVSRYSSKSKKGYDSDDSKSPRESSNESSNESKEKRKNRPKKSNPIPKKYDTYREPKIRDKGRQRSGTVDDGMSDDEFIRIRKSFKRESDQIKRRNDEKDKKEEHQNYIQMIQKSLRKRNSFVEGSDSIFSSTSNYHSENILKTEDIKKRKKSNTLKKGNRTPRSKEEG